MILTGPRVTLRPARADDVARLKSIRREPEVAARWGDPEEGEIEGLVGGQKVLVIEAGGAVIGAIQYSEEEDPMYRHAGIDIFVTTARHRQGFGSEAIRVLARYLIDKRGHIDSPSTPRPTTKPPSVRTRGSAFGGLG